jgi:hypothetical protein
LHRLRRPLLLAAIIGIFLAALGIRAWQLWTLVGANDWGSDWRWLDDGLERLRAGLPLNHADYVAGPFSQLPDGPAYTWSMHPPYNATLFSPSLLLPAALRQAAWTWSMAAAMAAAAWLAWPRGLWWGSHLLVATAVLVPPIVGIVDQLHYANPNALVVLGVVLVWHGRRRASLGLIVAGLVLAAIKILPAAALAAWLLAARHQAATSRRAVVLAAVVVAVLTLPVLLLDPGVIGDTIRVQLNLVPWDGPSNLAPQVLLAPVLGAEPAAVLSRVVGLGLIGIVLVRRLDGPGGFLIAASAPLLLTPQLWSHWFLIPTAAALLAAGTWSRLRDVDVGLRRLWTRRGSGQPSVAAPPAS